MSKTQAASLRSYVNRFPAIARQRGKEYFQTDAVVSIERNPSGEHYIAEVVGSHSYNVDLEFNTRTGWIGYCTCPVGIACKHIVAAALATAEMLEDHSPASASRQIPENVIELRPAAEPSKRRMEQPKPLSPLEAALKSSLNRAPNVTERHFIREVQELFRSWGQHGAVGMYALQAIAPTFPGNSWDMVDLWPSPPADDLQCWLYCAYEFQRRHVAIPDFMQPITQFDSIESQVKEWQRKRMIETWRTTLENLAPIQTSISGTIVLRCAVTPDRLRIQWKRDAEPDYRDLKHSHLRDFNHQHCTGEFSVSARSELLWTELARFSSPERALNLVYKSSNTLQLLRRLVSAQLLDLIVTAEGKPLAIAEHSLRYELNPADSEHADYQLRLVTSDGSPMPQILCAIPVGTSYYLTETALWPGPRWHGLGEQTLSIPAPALETERGLAFLTRLGLEMPPRLKERTRIIQPTIQVTAKIQRNYNNDDEVRISITASFDKHRDETLAADGWRQSNISEKSVEDAGVISVVDRTLLMSIPSPAEPLNARWEEYKLDWRVRLTKKFPEAFVNWLQSLPPAVELQLDKQLATLRNEPVSGTVRLVVEEAGIDWFDLKVVLDVTDTTLTPEEINLLLNARGGFVQLGKKGWRRLKFNFSDGEEETLSRLGLTAREFTAEPQRLHALQLADDAAKRFLPAEQVQQIQRRATEIATRVTPEIPAQIQAQLRPYQCDGFHFLAYLTANSFGGVLADDMGLGKTVQTITWLQWLRNTARQNRTGNPTPLPSLVVCPKSVMDNWRSEVERFCPGLRVRLWSGERASELSNARATADIVVLNYPQLRALSPEIGQLDWHAVILDEAQYIKNPDSQTAHAARALKAQHRLALTGTPIENRLLDLWSILSFAMPGVLGNRTHFARSFNQQDDPFARRRLSARVRPFVLRRTKSQVAKDLPDRVEEDLICEMEPEQLKLYRAEFKRTQQMLLKVKTQKQLNEQRFNFLTSLLRLRQICCHPGLVSSDHLKTESAKLNALLELIEPLMEEGHKVLVFSQFVSMLELVQEAVQAREWKHFFLSGDTENRGELVREFQSSPGAAVFLISLKAGGFGLNLTAASYVVLFDPWWNPAVENQAIDRTHRIGQTSKVIAYRLLIKDSIEQKIRTLQRTKAALAEDVLGEEKFSQSLTLDDLKFLFEGE